MSSAETRETSTCSGAPKKQREEPPTPPRSRHPFLTSPCNEFEPLLVKEGWVSLEPGGQMDPKWATTGWFMLLLLAVMPWSGMAFSLGGAVALCRGHSAHHTDWHCSCGAGRPHVPFRRLRGVVQHVRFSLVYKSKHLRADVREWRCRPATPAATPASPSWLVPSRQRPRR
jgi:hypothetical protein